MSKKKNWVGYKFNTFEVIEEDKQWRIDCEEKIKQGQLKRFNDKYICRCSCGNLMSISVIQIAKNKPLSCGCKSRAYGKDLTGMVFGDWTVLYRDFDLEAEKRVQGKTQHDYWRSQCICGTISSVLGSHLRRGASTGCGCKLREKISSAKTKNHVGEKHGNLTIKQVIRNSKNIITKIICKCDCGRTYNVYDYYQLLYGIISCCSKCKEHNPEKRKMAQYLRNQKKISEEGNFGEVLLNKFPNIELEKIWSDKNEYSPFEYTVKSHQTIHIVCPICGKEYTTSPLCLYSRVYDVICQNCLSEQRDSSLEKEVKHYLNKELGLETLHEHRCNLRPKNPVTGAFLPYDNEIVEQKIIIEVHGKQHYNELDKNCSWLNGKSPKQWLKELQERDEYKKQYAIQNGYKYIALKYDNILDGSYKKEIQEVLKEVTK